MTVAELKANTPRRDLVDWTAAFLAEWEESSVLHVHAAAAMLGVIETALLNQGSVGSILLPDPLSLLQDVETREYQK